MAEVAVREKTAKTRCKMLAKEQNGWKEKTNCYVNDIIMKSLIES